MPDAAPLRVLVQNTSRPADRPPITAEQLASALTAVPDLARPLDIKVALEAETDPAVFAAAEALLCTRLDPRDLVTRAPSLRWVHLTSAGVDGLLPLDWLPADVQLTNSRGAHAEKPGDFGLAALLMLNENMPTHVWHQRDHRWSPMTATPIRGKTVVILGMGHLGGAIAAKARLLGLRMIGVSRSGKPHPHCDRVVDQSGFEDVLVEADFLVIACPLTPETQRRVDAAALDRMRPSAGIVNIARAGVMDYDALARRLEAGRFSGAILDVFDQEPLPETARWWEVPRLIVVPHVSSDDGAGYMRRVLDIFVQNLRRYAAGQELANRVDRTLGY